MVRKMIFFLLFLSSAVFLSICRNRVTLFFWILIALISAFRFEVGTDYPNYVALYYDIKEGYQSYLHLEPFHYYLNEFSNYFDLGPQFVFLVYSIVTTFLFSLFYYKMSKGYSGLNTKIIFALCTILYVGNYYFLSLNSIRSCLAAALYVMSLYYYIQKRPLAMFSFLIIGAGIHYSLIPVALASVLLLKFVLPVKNKTFLIFSIILIANPISIVKYIFVTYKLMYFNYFLSDTYAVPASLIGQFSAYGGVALALVFYFSFMHYIGIDNKKITSVFQLSILLFVAFRIFSSELFIFARMSRYFSPVLYFFISLAIAYYLQKRVKKEVKQTTLLFFIVILVFSNIVMFIPRGLSDPSYSNYKINYCIYTTDVCEIPISIME